MTSHMSRIRGEGNVWQEKVSFSNLPADTSLRVLRVPINYSITDVELWHEDPVGGVVPTAGTMTLYKGSTNQLDVASVDLSSLTAEATRLQITTGLTADGTAKLATDSSDRDYADGDRLIISVINLACDANAELYVWVIAKPTPKKVR